MARRLTERQQKSRQASKIKARRRWQHALWRKCRNLAILMVVVAVSALGYAVYNGEVERTITRVLNNTHEKIASAGFAVEHIDLAGRQRTALTEVRQAIGFDLGESMLRVDLDEVRERLERIPTIKKAAASRNFPNRIAIHLYERQPVAVWQHKGELMLVDELGTVMSDLNLHQYQGLPLMVGKGAPEHVADVLKLYEMNEELASHIKSVIRVSDRRWDVRFSQNITVKLPEGDFEKSWQKLVKMHQDEQLLHRHIQAIDMRSGERMYITLAPGYQKRPVLTQTKDT